jgi:predicted CoA-binding protein
VPGTAPDAALIRRILQQSHVIAVVGLSADPARPSHGVARYLQDHGYRIIPVNPRYTEVLGEKCYASLREVPDKIDLVDCFRKSGDIPPIAEDAIAVGARVLWMQAGIVNEAAAARARAAGLEVVMDRCIKVDHAHLL